MNTIQLRQMYDINTNFQLELVYKGICKMLEDHPFMYAEFRKDMANNIQQIQGEASFTPQGRSIIGAWLSKLENSAQPADQPEVSGDVIPQFDNWMRGNPSPLMEQTRTTAINFLEDTIEWLMSYEGEFEDLIDEINSLLRKRKRVSIATFLEEINVLLQAIIEIYQELKAPVLDCKTQALDSGSSIQQMEKYIRQLAKEKTISKERALELLAIYNDSKSKPVGLIRLRAQLKNI